MTTSTIDIENRVIGSGRTGLMGNRDSNLVQTDSGNSSVSRPEWEKRNGHKGFVLWFTGPPGSGKTTLARELERFAFNEGSSIVVLDGDLIRQGLCQDLGFTNDDRCENLRRASEMAKILVSHGIIVVCAFVSPFAEQRELVRNIVGHGDFVEVFVKCSLNECARRDPKGLYLQARLGVVKGLSGYDAGYEAPLRPDLVIDTEELTISQCISELLLFLSTKGLNFGINHAHESGRKTVSTT
jgi:adenylylsulfate kinase